MPEPRDFATGWRYAFAITLFSLRILYRWLFSSLWGALFLAASLYWWVGRYTDTLPFSGSEMALWFAALPPDAMANLFSSLLTVLGFLIAFQAAHAAWRAELEASLTVDAAQVINDHYLDITRELNATAGYLNMMADAVDAANANPRPPSAYYSVLFICRQNAEAQERAKVTSERIVRANHFGGRYAPITLNRPACTASLEHANEILQEVFPALWKIVPAFDEKLDDFIDTFVAYAGDSGECRRQAQALTTIGERVAGLAGQARGVLMTAAVSPNVFALAWFVKHRRDIADSLLPVAEDTSGGDAARLLRWLRAKVR